jgi:hypothetical protein
MGLNKVFQNTKPIIPTTTTNITTPKIEPDIATAINPTTRPIPPPIKPIIIPTFIFIEIKWNNLINQQKYKINNE